MRDLIAALIAVLLVILALLLMASLQYHRRRRERARASEGALGRTIIAELPQGADLVLFSEDETRFYYDDERIDKDLIQAVRVLINGSPIAAYVSPRFPEAAAAAPTAFEAPEEGIARDRWDVAIETLAGTRLIPCGAIRERISQELARKIYEAVKRDLEWRDAANAEQRMRNAE
jgi:hypothetical protein